MPIEASTTVVCCTPWGKDWTWFVQGLTRAEVRWMVFSDQATRRWQRYVQRPNLVTPWATLRTVLAVRRTRARLLITMDGRLAFWCALWCRLLRVRVPHLVFSFNFPELPRGAKLPVFRFAFQQLTQVRVHSRMERDLYSLHFGIPLDRIRVALWAMNRPPVEPEEPLQAGEYVCAVGGNARDYATLCMVAQRHSEIPQVWVVRPRNLHGLEVPAHVRVVANISYGASMNFLAHSRFMVLPLKGAEVPCGHVTLVSAMYLEKAIVATRSAGISDYVTDGETGLLCEPGDADSLSGQMRSLWNNPAEAEQLGRNGLAFAQEHCSDESVTEEMTDYFRSLDLA